MDFMSSLRINGKSARGAAGHGLSGPAGSGSIDELIAWAGANKRRVHIA
jgi:hypothetical protein